MKGLQDTKDAVGLVRPLGEKTKQLQLIACFFCSGVRWVCPNIQQRVLLPIACWKIENMCKHLQLTTYAEASVCPTGHTPHHFNPSRNSDRQTPPTNLSSPWYHGYHGPTIPGWVSQTPFFIRKVCGSSGSANQRDPTPEV